MSRFFFMEFQGTVKADLKHKGKLQDLTICIGCCTFRERWESIDKLQNVLIFPNNFRFMPDSFFYWLLKRPAMLKKIPLSRG